MVKVFDCIDQFLESGTSPTNRDIADSIARNHELADGERKKLNKRVFEYGKEKGN